MFRSTSLVVVTLLALVHCGAEPPKPLAPSGPAIAANAATDLPAPPPPRADGRLPEGVAPRRYRLALDVDPNKPRFSGSVSIDVTLATSTRHVALHGIDIAVTRAVLRRGGEQIAARVTTRLAGGDEPEQVVLSFPNDVAAGDATLELAYDAPFSENLGGLYRVKEGDRWYAFTQFEATDARRAFPCFDEPGMKVPFEVTLRVPKGMLAFSNGQETSRNADGADGGRVAFGFAATPPLPTYLVAFAVGDFDVKAGPTTPVPIRLITTKGKTALGDLAIAEAAAITAGLADYFGSPFPYSKLDLVAVPNFRAGAMENAGLITFREEVLLLDSKKASLKSRRSLAEYMGHEVAHQWFGDLVTMKWWNDLWLNEGFATWMEAVIVDKVHPGFDGRLGDIAGTYEVMDTDALGSARAVRQPVTTSAEADEAFDGITYQKGAAVLGMIEAWIGPAAFQRGVRAYMTAHANGNATADDLFTALGRASSRDVSAMAATFLDRAGVPTLDVKAVCEKQRLVGIDLAQKPWAPLGASAAPQAKSPAAPWRIPVCLRVQGMREPQCTELTKESDRLAFPATSAPACPAWVYPNATETGYYRFALPEEGFVALAKSVASPTRAGAQLDAANKVGLLSNLWAQVRAGRVGADVLLRVLPLFDRETNRHVVQQVIATLDEIRATLVDDATLPAFRAYAAARLAPHKKQALGVADGAGAKAKGAAASEHVTILRQKVFRALGDDAEDAATLARAEELAKQWLADPSSVDADLAAPAVAMASRHADASRLEALRKAAREAKLPSDRVVAVTAMFTFLDPKVLEQALALTLTDEVRTQDFRYVGRGVRAHPSSRAIAYTWTKAHWAELRKKLKGRMAVHLVDFAGGACTEADRADAEAFLKKNTSDMDGAARAVAERLESLALCTALRTREAPNVTTALTHGISGASAGTSAATSSGRGLARP